MRRLALLVMALLTLAPTPAGALVAPPPGYVHELESEFGWARIDSADGGLLIARRDRIELDRGEQVDVLAVGVAPQYIAWDPSTGDAIFTNADGDVRRVHDGNVSTVAAGFPGVSGLDVASDGTIYVAHHDPGTTPGSVVTAISSVGVQTRFAGGGTACGDACKRAGAPAVTVHLEYLTSVAVEPDGDVLIAENRLLHRVAGGQLRTIAGNGTWCVPPDPCGDEGPALAAGFAEITSLAAGDDGSIYLAEHRSARIRVIRPDGVVHNLAGSFESCLKRERFDCIPSHGARSAIQPVVSIALSGDFLFAVDEYSWTRLLMVARVSEAVPVPPSGYRMVASDGGVFTFGWSPFHGSTGDIPLVSPIVAAASNGPGGYWFVAGDGGVFTFGDAGFYGSAVGRTTSPVVDIARSPSGLGYWLVERDGRVHAFGDAPHRGDGALPTSARVAAIVGARSGDGYRLVRTDGTQEDRQDQIGGQPATFPTLNRPIVHARPTSSGNGLWLVASDGGVFTQGDAGFFGSTGAMRLNSPVIDLVPTPSGLGYWLIAADGGVFTFGDAEFLGSMGAVRLNRPVVAGVAGPAASG